MKMIITKLELIKSPKGHRSHSTGTGTHKDKRLKRLGNRSQVLKRVFKDYDRS